MQKITCVLPNYSEDNANALNLCLYIGPDFLTYNLIDANAKTLVKLVDTLHVKHIYETLADIISQELAFLNIQDVKIIYLTQKQITLPAELFEPNYMKSQWALMKIEEAYQVIETVHSSFGIITVSSIPQAVTHLIKLTWPQAHFMSSFDLQLNHFRNSHKSLLSIDFRSSSIHILAIDNSQIQFQRHFEIENVNELAYFIKLCMQNFNISPEIDVYLSGLINDTDANYEFLKQTFTHLYLEIPQGPAHQLSLLEDYPIHYYSLLTSYALCE